MSDLVLQSRLISYRISPRLLVVNFLLLGVLGAAFTAGLVGGTYPISSADIMAAFLGEADGVVSMIVLENRLPRLLTAIGVGMAFGLAGEMTQTLLRNPLASPDVIGFTSGAGLGAVLTVAVSATTVYVLPGALVGGALTALLLFAITAKQDFTPGVLILVGIALTATLGVMTDLLLTRLDPNDTAELIKWIVGTLSARDWGDVALVWLGLALLFPLALWHQFSLSRLSLADDVATALGQRVPRARLLTLSLAVVLVGLAVAAAGPLPFVAFVAGPIAHGLNGAQRPTLLSAGLVGALVALLADKIAQSLPGFFSLPAGVFTALIGAPVLIWILIAQSRRGRL